MKTKYKQKCVQGADCRSRVGVGETQHAKDALNINQQLWISTALLPQHKQLVAVILY